MKNKITALLLAVMLVLVTFSLAACNNKQSLVYFLNFKPETADVFKEIAKAYESETGVKVKVVTAAANTYEQTLKSEIEKSDAPTIFQVNGPVGYNEWDDYCLDISNSKLYSYLSDESLAIKEDGGVYAVAYVVEGYGIIYNDEIMQRYFALPEKKTDITSMDEIRSFDTLKAVVEDMSSNLKALGIEGVFASTSLSSGEDWRWQTHLLNVPLFYEFSENNNYNDPTLAGLDADKIEFKYFENFQNIFDLYINNSITQSTLLGSKSTADSMAEFALGKVAMVQNGNWAWSQIADVQGNTVKEQDIKFLPIYTGVKGEESQGICIGTENYIAINKYATDEQQKASLDFLDWLFSSETGKSYVANELDYITPFNTFSEDELPNDPLAREVVRYMNDDNYQNVSWSFTSFPSEEFKTRVGSYLLDYAQGTTNWDNFREEVVKKWESER